MLRSQLPTPPSPTGGRVGSWKLNIGNWNMEYGTFLNLVWSGSFSLYLITNFAPFSLSDPFLIPNARH